MMCGANEVRRKRRTFFILNYNSKPYWNPICSTV